MALGVVLEQVEAVAKPLLVPAQKGKQNEKQHLQYVIENEFRPQSPLQPSQATQKNQSKKKPGSRKICQHIFSYTVYISCTFLGHVGTFSLHFLTNLKANT